MTSTFDAVADIGASTIPTTAEVGIIDVNSLMEHSGRLQTSSISTSIIENGMDNIPVSIDVNHSDDASSEKLPLLQELELTQMYDPEMIARYIDFYKNYNLSQNRTKKIKTSSNGSMSKRHMPSILLDTRRTIQFCCRDNNLRLALETFNKALRGLIYLEPQSFYNILSLCEGSFADREREGRVHVGTPKHCNRVNSPETEINENKVLVGGEPNHDRVREKQEDAGIDKVTFKAQTPASTIEEISLLERLYHANKIYSFLKTFHIPCIEPAYTALIRLSSRVGDFPLAEKYLDEAESTQQCKVKLRLYSCLLRSYCGGSGGKPLDKNINDIGREKDDSFECAPTKDGLVNALKVWKRMYDKSGGLSSKHSIDSNKVDGPLFGEGVSPKINLSEIEYTSLIQCATALHDASVMERVLSDLAERVLVPGLNTTKEILNWFRSDCVASDADGCKEIDTEIGLKSTALNCVTLPPREGDSIGVVTNRSGRGWIIYHNCTVNVSTGELSLDSAECEICFAGELNHGKKRFSLDQDMTRFRLRPVELSEIAWEEMRKMNEAIVLEGQVKGHVSQYQGGGKGKKRTREGDRDSNSRIKQTMGNCQNTIRLSDWRFDAWKSFNAFIQNHPPYNVVIDGANVGYFQQNFTNAPKHVDYKQIDWLLRHILEKIDWNSSNSHNFIILFLHERHFSPKLCPSWALPIIQAWDSDISPYNRLSVFRTPAGMNDDWYWMHAALVNGGKKTSPSVRVVTNDEMRDHHFQMLAQGSFLRWKERHQIHFNFGSWNKNMTKREVLLRYPSIYSRRIQRLCENVSTEAIVIPLPKRGDEGRYVDGAHVADESAPEDETYVLVRKVD